MIGIYIDTPAFDVVTKDEAATFTDMLSNIGGTFGLLTGFFLIDKCCGHTLLYNCKVPYELCPEKEEIDNKHCQLELLLKIFYHMFPCFHVSMHF